MTKLRSHRGSNGTLGVLGSLVFAHAAMSGCDSSTPSNTSSSCPVGEKKCACYGNGSCDEGLVCISDVCVAASSGGVGGATNQGGAQSSAGGQVSTTSQSGGSAGTTETTGIGGASAVGGTTSSVAGASSDMGGAAPTVGGAPAATGGAPATTGGAPAATGGVPATTGGVPAATGGAPAATGGVPAATGGAPTATGGAPAATGGVPAATGGAPAATGGTTAVSNVIDDFSTCDKFINSASGRGGSWFSYADAELNLTMGFGDPGTMWTDHSCAAFVTAGCSQEPSTLCTFGGAGVQLAAGNPYDLSGYTGVKVTVESSNDVYFMVNTCTDSGCATKYSYGVWMLGGSGSYVRTVAFSTLAASSTAPVGSSPNLRYTTELHFTIGKALAISTGGFGMAIHRLELY